MGRARWESREKQRERVRRRKRHREREEERERDRGIEREEADWFRAVICVRWARRASSWAKALPQVVMEVMGLGWRG